MYLISRAAAAADRACVKKYRKNMSAYVMRSAVVVRFGFDMFIAQALARYLQHIIKS